MEQKDLIWSFVEEDLDQLIQGARLSAIEQVKEKLTLVFTDVLTEKAIKRIAESVLMNKESHQLKELNVPKDELKELKILKKLTEANFIYLIGITICDAKGMILKKNLSGMDGETQVYPVVHQELVAIVCRVSKEEFTETKIQELTENKDWLEEKAERHQEIIALLAEMYPVIPMRFSTLYHSEEQLKLFLKENYHDLITLLKKIRHKTEWSLKLYLDEDIFREFLQKKDEGINKLIDEMSLDMTGKEYLLKKRLAHRIERKAFDLAEEVHRRLCRFSSGAILKKLLPMEVTGRKEQMILNGAYLLDNTQKEDFFQVIDLMKEREGPRGFIFEISGPWPCYNFCQISAAST